MRFSRRIRGNEECGERDQFLLQVPYINSSTMDWWTEARDSSRCTANRVPNHVEYERAAAIALKASGENPS